MHIKTSRRQRQGKLLKWLCILTAALCIVTGLILQSCISRERNVGSSLGDLETGTYEPDRQLSKSSLQEESNQRNIQRWNLILVNAQHKLPKGFSPDLVLLQHGHAVDRRAYPSLQAMMDAARSQGLSPLICSSYRTQDMQQELYSRQVSQYMARGYERKQAEKQAAKWVARPGTSEHQTGLALDIVSAGYQLLDNNQEKTPEQRWLMKNAHKYGFILRYPKNKKQLTGISYEPWHYRYVGKRAAKEIYKKGICLEEYLDSCSGSLTL